ncbi:MAG: hypothetical protein A2Z30_07370 [Chloroflexi bacterium RBG_16_64_43]|nr:MAG: hypothetical protein A2Z30_07370 [Chloroflexi bacterium RBG_16_64_43]
MTEVLVTGAGGYIGSVLCRLLLEAGDSVLAVDRFHFGRLALPEDGDRLRTLTMDIRALERTQLAGVRAIIDLAAISNDPAGELDPSKTWEINHQARVRLARLAKAAGVPRYILPSSCSIYGFQEGIMTEESPVNPLTTYAQANLRAEQDILPLSDDTFCAVVIRQATVYGPSPRMRFDLAVNGMVKGFFKNRMIPILRDGNQWRPFVHVRDTSRAMIKILRAPEAAVSGQIFNIGGDDQNVQILPLARVVADAMEVPFEYEWYGSADNRSYRVSFGKAREVLGFVPELSPGNGAAQVFTALREGTLDAEDPRTITVQWYKHLMSQGVSL